MKEKSWDVVVNLPKVWGQMKEGGVHLRTRICLFATPLLVVDLRRRLPRSSVLNMAHFDFGADPLARSDRR